MRCPDSVHSNFSSKCCPDLTEHFLSTWKYLRCFVPQKVVKIRDTKFGVAMVLEAVKLVLGFKVDPYDVLKKTVKEIQSLHQVYSSCPIFGVEYSDVDEGEEPATPTSDAIQEDVELVHTRSDTLAVSPYQLPN